MNTKTRVRQRNTRLNCEVLESRQVLSGYFIVNAASGLALDDPGFSTKSGTVIQQFQPNGGENQLWNLDLNSPSFVQNAYSGKVLSDPGFSKQNGTKIQQSNLKIYSNLNQEWNFIKLKNGNYEVQNAYSLKALDDPGSSTKNGTQIQQYTFHGGLNQEWVLLPVGTIDQDVFIANASSNKVLIDPGFSTQNNTQIRQYTLNYGLSSEQWDLVGLANGNDLIVNVSSGKVLTGPGFITVNGTVVEQHQLNGALDQQWQLVVLPQENGGSVYEVRNASSGLVLTDPNSSTSNGTLIEQDSFDGASNQQWYLIVNPPKGT
jgi:glucosylceramidase